MLCFSQAVTASVALSELYPAVPGERPPSSNAKWIALGVLWSMAVYAWGLCGFHTLLACTNLTTYELRRPHKLAYLEQQSPGSLPFSHGLVTNLRIFCIELGISPMLSRAKWSAKVWVLTTRPAVSSKCDTGAEWDPLGSLV